MYILQVNKIRDVFLCDLAFLRGSKMLNHVDVCDDILRRVGV